MNDIVVKGLVEEVALRTERIAAALQAAGADAILISSNANIYYALGRVVAGYVYITAAGDVQYFIRRPLGLEGANVHYIRKPELIAEMLDAQPKVLALEMDMAYSDVVRLQNAFAASSVVDGSRLMKKVRSVKTAFEISLLKRSGIRHAECYSAIPHMFNEGMSDLELQVELERKLRLSGCLGLFRISGQSMEMFMGNILVGENADNPTPYDFAMGGAGLDKSIPVGANGSIIRRGMTVMVDICGNFTGYMTDMTRSFKVGEVGELAEKAHACSVSICHAVAKMAKPGAQAADLYRLAEGLADEAGLADYFMGHVQKAGFVGHGVGIEVNEAPVLAPKSKDVLEEGNVFALEPKFVIPNVGAVGIENTYVVTAEGAECITNLNEDLIQLAEY